MNKRIMILEDNVTTLKLLSQIVRSILPDADIREFSSIDGAYDTALSCTIDLFLVDIIINNKICGDTTGIKFVNSIRMVSKYEFTPVIFITSLEDPKLYTYNQLHSFSYIEKPFDMEYVKDVITQALRFPNINRQENALFFRVDGIIYTLKTSEILYMESFNHKIRIYRTAGDVMIVPYRTCKQILKDADVDELIQCSRNAIVNKTYIESIDLSNWYIKLKGLDTLIDIGVTYHKQMSRAFKDDL